MPICLAVVLGSVLRVVLVLGVILVVVLRVVLGVVLAVVVLILVVVLIAVLVLVLIVHSQILHILLLRYDRYGSLPRLSGFILGFEDQTGKQPGNDGSGYAAGGCFQTTGEDAETAILTDGLLHAFCQGVAEAGQRNGRSGSREINDGLIEIYHPKSRRLRSEKAQASERD